jgi:AAA ATPase domain
MGRVRRPVVPDGPIKIFYDRLHALHQASGWPSMRELQRRTRSQQRPNGINPTTIHDALSRPQLAQWDVVEALVSQLGGDTEEFAELWRAGRATEFGTPSDRERESRTGSASDALAPPGQHGQPVPRQLPMDITPFAGRTRQLAELTRLFERSTANGAAVVAVTGTAGVGKTALAVHWAHRVADRFPDGQLYLNLRGYDPDQPISPGSALAGILTALGVPGQDIPLDLDDRAARYRTEISGRRMLIVLDNAGSVEQVRPLLPGTPTCATVVTSRDTCPPTLVERSSYSVCILDPTATPTRRPPSSEPPRSRHSAGSTSWSARTSSTGPTPAGTACMTCCVPTPTASPA